MKQITLFTILILSLSSCATVLTGGTKTVKIKNLQPDQHISYNGQTVKGSKVKVSRKDPGTITIHRPKCQDQTITLTRKVSVGYIITDVCCGLVPLGVDLITGSIYKPTQTKINSEPCP